MVETKTTLGPGRAVAERNIEAILAAAEQLLVSGRGLSLSAVATGAGVSRPTLYSHFPDRVQLLTALVERNVRLATEAMQSVELGKGSTAELMSRVIAVAWEQLARHTAIARAAATELPMEMLREHHLQGQALLEELIVRGQDKGDFRDDLSAAWLASSCLAIIHAAADAVASGRMRADAAVDALQRTVVDLCVGRRRRRSRSQD